MMISVDDGKKTQNRQIEQRREEIAQNIAQSHQEYQQGKVFRGTINNIIVELNK